MTALLLVISVFQRRVLLYSGKSAAFLNGLADENLIHAAEGFHFPGEIIFSAVNPHPNRTTEAVCQSWIPVPDRLHSYRVS